MDFTGYLKKFGAIIAFAFIASFLFCVTWGSSFFGGFFLLMVFLLPFILIKSEPLALKFAVGYMIIVGVIFFAPIVFPSFVKSLLSRRAYTDHLGGEAIRPPDNSKVDITTDVRCSALRDNISKRYSKKSIEIIDREDLSDVEKAKQIGLAKKEANTELEGVNKECEKETPQSAPALNNQQSTSASTSSSDVVGGKKFRFTVSSSTPWLSTGIDVTGKTVTVRVISGCWSNDNKSSNQCGEGLGPYPGTILSSAPIGELIGKTNSGFHRIGQSGSINNSRGILSLGMNEVPGTYSDNQGSITVEITVQGGILASANVREANDINRLPLFYDKIILHASFITNYYKAILVGCCY